MVLVLYREDGRIEVFAQQHLANSREDAVVLAVKTEQVVELLINGYVVKSKTSTELHETVSPLNSAKDCLVVRNNDNSLSHLHIDLRPEYDDDFKQDLQALMSKYFVNIPAIYPEFNP